MKPMPVSHLDVPGGRTPSTASPQSSLSRSRSEGSLTSSPTTVPSSPLSVSKEAFLGPQKSLASSECVLRLGQNCPPMQGELVTVECRISAHYVNPIIIGMKDTKRIYLVAIDMRDLGLNERNLDVEKALRSKAGSVDSMCAQRVKLANHTQTQIVSLSMNPLLFHKGRAAVMLQVVVESKLLRLDRWMVAASLPITVMQELASDSARACGRCKLPYIPGPGEGSAPRHSSSALLAMRPTTAA